MLDSHSQTAGELDEAFMSHVVAIRGMRSLPHWHLLSRRATACTHGWVSRSDNERRTGHASKLGSRHEKIRIQKWLAALSEPMQQMVWKKNRNLHSMCLAEMLARGKVRKSFLSLA